MNWKNVTILILGLFATEICFAQNEFRFGIKGAAKIGWIQPSSKTVTGSGAKLGYSYGIVGDYYFRPNYAISTELLISQINGAITLSEPQYFNSDTSKTMINALDYTFKAQYAEIPISLKFRTKEIGYITYWAQFGTSPSFLISAKATINNNLPAELGIEDPTDFRVNDDEGQPYTTNAFDDQVFLIRVPLIIGGGIEYKIAGSTSLVGGLRFSNSFTDMFVKDKRIDAKNNFVSLCVGVLF